jgi:antitoxin MazE
METKIQKWGNSLGVRLPKSVTKSHSLEDGSLVRVSTNNEKIVIERVRVEKPTLEDLVGRITDLNMHGETIWGKPQGSEVW